MKQKPLTSFDAAEQWCDYGLLSTVAHLLEQDAHTVRIPPLNTRTVAIIPVPGDYVSLKDLARLMLHIADHLENAENYK